MTIRAHYLIAGLIGAAFLLFAQSQRGTEQSVGQIAVSSPLPVYVTNSSAYAQLPEGFVQGSRWRFTTWTSPSVLTWTADVQRTVGPWANLTVHTQEGGSSTRWYYIPGMPGSWEKL